jgi:hypothetical protein
MQPRLKPALLAILAASLITTEGADAAASWKVGTPIVTYWCGPTMTDAVAHQMSEGGWNLVWCGEGELDVARRHGLRAQLTDGLLTPASLDNPAQREKLDALIERVRRHPSLYAYFITDEPGAGQFPALGRLVAYLRERDPAHLAYINLFPTYASNEQLGNQGDVVAAYREHLRQFVEVVKPALLSYDHYQFALKGDTDQYFLNLALVRRAALDAGLPFLNIVQASTWAPATMRVPGPDEMRYLVYTTLAYGAEGISYYIYTCGNHLGGIANADGTPTVLYEPLKRLNHEFTAIAAQLQNLRSVGVYHAGMSPRGTEPVPADLPFRLDPTVPEMPYQPPERVRGVLFGCFGPKVGSGSKGIRPTHAVVVNLDYRAIATVGLRSISSTDVFEPETSKWTRLRGRRTELQLPPGGGRLIRLRRSSD